MSGFWRAPLVTVGPRYVAPHRYEAFRGHDRYEGFRGHDRDDRFSRGFRR
jgi:hypothetical protein